MRILIYSLNYSPESIGIGKYNGEMAEWLIKHGHDVKILTTFPYYPEWKKYSGYNAWYKIEKTNNVYILRCPCYIPKNPNGIRRILHYLSFSIVSFPVLLAQITWKPDIIFTTIPSFLNAPGVWFLSKFIKTTTWLHIQDFDIDAAIELGIIHNSFIKKILINLESFFIRRFDRVSTISLTMKERLDKKGVRKERQVLLPNWIDLRKYCFKESKGASRQYFSIKEDSIVALYSGSMGEKHGLELLIECARRLQEKENLLFIFCGEGVARKKLQEISHGLQNIVWLPLQPENRYVQLMNSADIHLLPQRPGAANLVMPSKLAAMMASARPVVATVGKDTEIYRILKGRGVCVEPENLDELVSEIKKLASDEGKRRRLGANAREYAESYLDKEKILKKMINEFEVS